MTDSAERRDTSCSPLRPPYRTAILRFKESSFPVPTAPVQLRVRRSDSPHPAPDSPPRLPCPTICHNRTESPSRDALRDTSNRREPVCPPRAPLSDRPRPCQTIRERPLCLRSRAQLPPSSQTAI